MGVFELDEKEKQIYCHERPEDSGNWWTCDINKEELKKIKNNELSMFDVMNDGRKTW